MQNNTRIPLYSRFSVSVNTISWIFSKLCQLTSVYHVPDIFCSTTLFRKGPGVFWCPKCLRGFVAAKILYIYSPRERPCLFPHPRPGSGRAHGNAITPRTLPKIALRHHHHRENLSFADDITASLQIAPHFRYNSI